MTAGPTDAASGRYTIEEKIGQGGLGTVFRAWDTQLKRRVAIKRLREEGPADRERIRSKVLQEATNLASLQHPNVVTIYDIATDTEGPFVVMEFVEGENLESVVERGVFPKDDFVKFACQSLEGLAAAHRAGLIHRDLKPGNVMLTWLQEGGFQVKLLDFGLAKLVKMPTVQSEDQTEGILGSIHTMAPEQFRREPLDPRTDLYSMGCIFYFVLTGYFPFEGTTPAEVMASHLEHRVRSVADYRPDVPLEICQWVMALIAEKAAERPASAKAALAVLDAIVNGPRPRTPDSAGPVPMVPRETTPAQTARKRSPIPGLLLAGAVLAGGAAGWYWWSQQQSKATPGINHSEISTPAEPVSNEPFDSAKSAAGPLLDARSTMDPSIPAEIYPASDVETLRSLIGKHIIVEGRVQGSGENKLGTVRYLSFGEEYRNGLSLVVFGRPGDPQPPELDYTSFIGKMIRADGILSESKGALFITVRSAAQISVLD